MAAIHILSFIGLRSPVVYFLRSSFSIFVNSNGGRDDSTKSDRYRAIATARMAGRISLIAADVSCPFLSSFGRKSASRD